VISTLFAITIVTFLIIQLPPGGYLTVHVASLAQTGEVADEAELAALAKRYGLNEP